MQYTITGFFVFLTLAVFLYWYSTVQPNMTIEQLKMLTQWRFYSYVSFSIAGLFALYYLYEYYGFGEKAMMGGWKASMCGAKANMCGCGV